MHVRDLLERRAAAHPDKTFLIFETVETFYRAFDTKVNQVANGLRPDTNATAEALQDWCRARLAAFKIPNRIAFREALPKTPTQRVEKYKLREEYVREQSR